jgi:nicotinic acid mononucleotide adenylyltransferase
MPFDGARSYPLPLIMEFLHRASSAKGSLALLPGAWNPPTRAHVAMLRAALAWAEEGILVLPRALPHKEFEGAGIALRAAWITVIAASQGLSAAISDGGLFIEMARECRAATGASEIHVVCGRDAAERIVGWDYGAGGNISPIDAQLHEYQMLVAPRGGVYAPPAHLAGRIHALRIADDWHEVSSTEVRQRLADGAAWEELVPEEIAADVRAAY